MAKTILGIDIGHNQLKLALVKGKHVLRTAIADMPEHLLQENRIVSRESMAEMLRNTMKQNRLRASQGAFVLPNESVFIKNVEMPPMTVDQLVYNLPFEFNDYITGDRKEYVFDYAVISTPEDKPDDETAEEKEAGEEGEPTMELMAVGVHRSLLEDARDTLRKSGLRLVRTAPALSAYISLIRSQKDFLDGLSEEYGILDLGYQSIRMYMFKHDRHVATRVLEVGMSRLDDVLAEAYGVDVHLAHTYLMSNYDNCLEREECRAAYESIAVELMRAMNFYRFSNPNTTLSDLWGCGGGAMIRPLIETIGDMLGLQLHPASELVPNGENIANVNSLAQAIGIAMY